MKRIVNIWIILSFVLSPLQLLRVMNMYLSLKYEAEEAKIFPHANPMALIQSYERLLYEDITNFWFLFVYFLVNGIVLLYLRKKIIPAIPLVK